MARVPITDVVLDQLRDVVVSNQVDDPAARYDVQALAFDRGHDELGEFVATADASTYFEAVTRVSDVSARERD